MNVLFIQSTYIKRHLKIEQLFMNLHTTNIRSRYCLLYARNVIQWGPFILRHYNEVMILSNIYVQYYCKIDDTG